MSEKIEANSSQWDSRLSFLMAMIGAAIGLGNIWRYPYVVYSNGGGAFIIPYVIAILLLGLPFLILEYGVGYKFKTSLVNILRKIKSKFEVLGWFVSLIAFLVLTYYVCIIGWDLIYLILSFFKGWGSNPDIFFSTTLLHSTNSLAGLTTLVWPIVLSLVIVWFIVWFISHRDLNSGISKVTKVLIPSLIMIMAFVVIYSLTLPGASIGYTSLFTPDWNALLNPNIWLAAFGQILFSLSLGWSVIVTYASYLPEGSKLTDNGLIVVVTNCGFEFFTAIGVFSILGFMALSQGVDINNVVTQGTGLIFVALPTVFNIMGDFAYILGPLFFLCVFFAGITTTISFLEPLSLAITRKFEISRKKSTTILCLIGFFASLLFATGSGNYLLGIFDSFLNQFGILFGIICQCLIFGWIYKLDAIKDAINEYSTINVGKTWEFLIKFVIPIILVVVWLSGLYTLFSSGDIVSIVVQLIIAAVLVIIPVILTKLPSAYEKSKN